LLKQIDRITQKLGVERIENFIYKETKGHRRLLKEAEKA